MIQAVAVGVLLTAALLLARNMLAYPVSLLYRLAKSDDPYFKAVALLNNMGKLVFAIFLLLVIYLLWECGFISIVFTAIWDIICGLTSGLVGIFTNLL
jgi:hypothetical protein